MRLFLLQLVLTAILFLVVGLTDGMRSRLPTALFGFQGLFLLFVATQAPFIGLQFLTKSGHVRRPLVELWSFFSRLPIPEGIRSPIREWALYLNSYKLIVGAGSIILAEDKRHILLLHHRYPLGRPTEFWGLPAGGVHKDNGKRSAGCAPVEELIAWAA